LAAAKNHPVKEERQEALSIIKVICPKERLNATGYVPCNGDMAAETPGETLQIT
jgi:hypothetical protein